MEGLPETKVSWDAESGSSLEGGQVTPQASPSSPQSDPYSPPAPFPPPPQSFPEDPHHSVQPLPAAASTALIPLHLVGASVASDSSSEGGSPEERVQRIITRFTEAGSTKQCVLITLVESAPHGLNFAFDKTGALDLPSLGVHGVNFLRCNILGSPPLPDFDKMGLPSAIFEKPTDSLAAHLRACIPESDETPVIFLAGFDNGAFSRSVRLNPNAPKKFKLVRYEVMGIAKDFRNFKTGYGSIKREKEAWGALIKMFDRELYSIPMAPELELLATDFYSGKPVLEPIHYMARHAQEQRNERPSPRAKNHVITYNNIGMSYVLDEDILEKDMQLSRFLFDTAQNARLQEYQENSEHKMIKITDMIFWTPANKKKPTGDTTSPSNLGFLTELSGVAEASGTAPVDESTTVEEPVSAPPVSSKNTKKNAKNREKAKAKAANNKNNGVEPSTSSGNAESSHSSTQIEAGVQAAKSTLVKETAPVNQGVDVPTIVGGLVAVEDPTMVNKPSEVKKATNVNKSLVGASSQVYRSAPVLDLSLVEPHSVGTQKSSYDNVGDASLSGTENNASSELNAANLAALGGPRSPSRSEFNYEDFNSLYDVSDNDNVAEWNVVRSKSSKKATKQNQSRTHSQLQDSNQPSNNNRSGDSTPRVRHHHPPRRPNQPKNNPKPEPKSSTLDTTKAFNLNMEEYPPLAPVASKAAKQDELSKEPSIGKRVVDGSTGSDEDKYDTGKSKTSQQDDVKNDAVKDNAGKSHAGKTDTAKNNTGKNDAGLDSDGKAAATKNNAGGTKAVKNVKNDGGKEDAGPTDSVKIQIGKNGDSSKSDCPKAESKTHADSTLNDPLSGPDAKDACQSFSTQITDGPSTIQELDDSLLTEKDMLSAASTGTNDGDDGKSESSDEFRVVVWTSEAVIDLLLGPSQDTKKVLTRFKSGSVSDFQRLMAEEDAQYDSELEDDPSTQRSRAGSVADINYSAQHSLLSKAHRAAQQHADQDSQSDANITVVQHHNTHDNSEHNANNQPQFAAGNMAEQYPVRNGNPAEQNANQQFVSGPSEHSPVVPQPGYPALNHAAAQYNPTQHSVPAVPHVHTHYPAHGSTVPGYPIGHGTTLGGNTGSGGVPINHAQTAQHLHARHPLPPAFAVCTYCMKLPSGGPESQVICPGCGPDHYVRYCSVACLLADSLDHSLCCLRRPITPRSFEPNLPQHIYRSLTPMAPPLTVSIETPERFRQRTFSIFCSSGPYPPILASWARKMNIDLHGVVNGTDWFKKAGDYAIFRSDSTGLPSRPNPKADVIFTVILQMNDPRKQYLVRVLNACFIDPRLELVVFLFRTILVLLKDPEYYRLTKYYESREIVIQEFMLQFEKEWGIKTASWLPDADYDMGQEWLYVLRTLQTIEYMNPVLGQAWPTLYTS